MKNITLRVPAELLRRLQHIAVDEGVSLSAWVVKHFQRCKGVSEKSGEYEKAKRSALRRLRKGLPLGGSYLSREESHER
jgi:hypothetical protein